MAERTNGTSGNGADLAQRVKTEAKISLKKLSRLIAIRPPGP